MTSDEQLVLLQSVVALRVQGRQVRESVRVGLASIEDALLAQAGPLVRKRVAARLLDCSVQSLDRWIAKGALEVQPIAEGSSRMAIPTSTLVDLAFEQRLLPAPSLAKAFDNRVVRIRRTAEFHTAHDLTLFAHRIAAAARQRRMST